MLAGGSGLSKTSGTNGTSGTTGATGTSGNAGASGLSKTSGTNGTTGTTGVTGLAGASALSATSGSSGTNGTNGNAGANGLSRTSGVSGTSGTTGSNGTAGAIGASGLSRLSGTSGSSGTTGTNGTTGPGGGSGQAGSSGTSGTAGISGNVGSSGTYVTISAGIGMGGGGLLNTNRTLDLKIVSNTPPELVYWDGSQFTEFGQPFIANPNGLDGGGFIDIQNLNILSANSKFFDIEHPTKGNPHRLQYGVLEGPENGVFLRGTTNEKTIKLPDYWVDLVHADSITVQLTPIGNACIHYVVSVLNNEVNIGCECGDIKAYYTINAERKDVDAPKLEYIKE
jgi:hypothetical protein